MSFYNDNKLDESYTPQRISIRGGTDFHDLKELVILELEDLSGWTNIKLEDAPGRYDNNSLLVRHYAVDLRYDLTFLSRNTVGKRHKYSCSSLLSSSTIKAARTLTFDSSRYFPQRSKYHVLAVKLVFEKTRSDSCITNRPALIQDEQIPFEDPKFMQFASLR